MLVPRLVWRGGIAVVEHTRPGALGAALIVKRVLDVVGAAALLVALAPLMVAVGILIRLQSDGPVLFRQVRHRPGWPTVPDSQVPHHGRRHRRPAWRAARNSLYTDGRLFKVPGDPRITPLGAILRRTSIDELPQLWNVLLGDMSLVGPRPPMPSEVALYRDKDYARFDVKPGITGPWQVSGRNASATSTKWCGWKPRTSAAGASGWISNCSGVPFRPCCRDEAPIEPSWRQHARHRDARADRGRAAADGDARRASADGGRSRPAAPR